MFFSSTLLLYKLLGMIRTIFAPYYTSRLISFQFHVIFHSCLSATIGISYIIFRSRKIKSRMPGPTTPTKPNHLLLNVFLNIFAGIP